MFNVELYTDGACSGNPGPGGWCAVLKSGTHERILSGSEKETTNNRMELTAVIEGLKALNKECNVTVTSDSKYVCDAINKNWLNSWVNKGWKKSDGKAVLNVELWQELYKLTLLHNISFIWIKGHDGHPQNEQCDKIAVSEYQKYL